MRKGILQYPTLISALLGLTLLLASCDSLIGISAEVEPLPTVVAASPIALVESTPSPVPPTTTPSPTNSPTNTATATVTPTATRTATPSPTPAARAVKIVIEYGGKSYSQPIDATEALALVTYTASGALAPNKTAIQVVVEKFSKAHERSARNSTFRWDYARKAPIVIADSLVGVEIDEAETAKRLGQALIGESGEVVTAAYLLTEPKYSAKNPPTIGSTALATVSHHYDRTEASGKNQEIGVRYLDGAIVLPGEVFSNDSLVFRQGVGVYHDSPVNVGSTNTLAPGGGLCSLATIGFQAAFLSGMEIVERHPHLYWITSYAITYRGVAYRGLDATTGNMRWRNTTGYPVRVRAWADGSQSHVQIVGTNPDWQVSIKSYADSGRVPAPTTVQVLVDPKRPVGFSEVVRDPHDGRDVSLTREVWKGATLIRRDRFVSHYAAVGKQILRGPTS